MLLPYLTSTKAASTLTGQQEIVNIVMDQLELDAEFDVPDKDNNSIDKLVTCIKFILPIFSVSKLLIGRYNTTPSIFYEHKYPEVTTSKGSYF